MSSASPPAPVATERFDVVVVGAGPAGSAAAAVLAGHGRRVALLEKEPFPRYRVGESLIPYCWFPLARLGLIERLDAAPFTVPKHSVQFVDVEGTRSTPFYFARHTDHDCARTWQVERGEFDRLLRDNAVERGATLFEGTRARALVHQGEREGDGVAPEGGRPVVGVDATGPDGPRRFRAPVTIDASGRELFAATARGWRVADRDLRKLAIWTYFRGGRRAGGVDEGATTIAYLPGKGWIWHIPLPDDRASVGVVAEPAYLYREGRGDPDALFARERERQPWIRAHLAGAVQLEPCRVTGEYSYRARHCAADGLVLAGDAFAFLDPVFSSGVFLALQGGVLAGDAVHEALAAAGDVDAVGAARFEDYGARCRQGLEAMRRLVHAFYDPGFSFGGFLQAHPEHSRALTDCLIGNVEVDLEPLFEAVAAFARIPPPLAHGRPLVAPVS